LVENRCGQQTQEIVLVEMFSNFVVGQLKTENQKLKTAFLGVLYEKDSTINPFG
jgi:hypothetical protein